MKTLVYLTTNYIESSKPTNPLQKDFLHQYLPFEGLWSWHAAFWSQLFLPKSHLIPMPSPDFSCASKELDHLPLQQLWMPKKANYPVSKNKTKTTKNPTQKSFFFFCGIIFLLISCLTLSIRAIRIKYLWWAILCFCITRWTMGIKMVNFGPICITMAHRVSMAVLCSSGTESRVLTKGWMIREAKSVRSRVKVNLSTVSRAVLKKENEIFIHVDNKINVIISLLD